MQILEQVINSQIGLVAGFIITATIVVVVGIRLSIYGDALGDRTGLGQGLIGLIFLAAVTSLPELVVSLTSVIQNSNIATGADLATGNMLGSNIFNLLILALVALIFPKKFIPKTMNNPHTASTVYGLVLLAIFSIAFLTSNQSAPLFLLECGWGTLLLPIAYLIMLVVEHRQLSRASSDEEEEDAALPAEEKLLHTPALTFYSILGSLCILIIGGGIILSILGSRMALPPEQGGFGLNASMIGTIFLAISTSLPELVISITSVRLGFLNMAVGNVLGSNMFNLLIIFAADVAMRKNVLLSQASPSNWISVGVILVLTLLAAVLLRTRKQAETTLVALLMSATYIASLFFS